MRIEILKIRSQYSYSHKRNYSVVYYKVCEGQYYPARNSNFNTGNILILDGLVGDCKLTSFASKFERN